jgi:hypothetical protein
MVQTSVLALHVLSRSKVEISNLDIKLSISLPDGCVVYAKVDTSARLGSYDHAKVFDYLLQKVTELYIQHVKKHQAT